MASSSFDPELPSTSTVSPRRRQASPSFDLELSPASTSIISPQARYPSSPFWESSPSSNGHSPLTEMRQEIQRRKRCIIIDCENTLFAYPFGTYLPIFKDFAADENLFFFAAEFDSESLNLEHLCNFLTEHSSQLLTWAEKKEILLEEKWLDIRTLYQLQNHNQVLHCIRELSCSPEDEHYDFLFIIRDFSMLKKDILTTFFKGPNFIKLSIDESLSASYSEDEAMFHSKMESCIEEKLPTSSTPSNVSILIYQNSQLSTRQYAVTLINKIRKTGFSLDPYESDTNLDLRVASRSEKEGANEDTCFEKKMRLLGVSGTSSLSSSSDMHVSISPMPLLSEEASLALARSPSP